MEVNEIGVISLKDKLFRFVYGTHERLATAEEIAEAKLKLYREGKYNFPVPAGAHGNWTEQDWINYIDMCGEWIIPIDKVD